MLTEAERRTLDNLICLTYLDGDITYQDREALLTTVTRMRGGLTDERGVLNGWRR